ncbi:calcium-binding protein [Marinomonas ostreistagni]|uniref:Calcium-binding protein n=1 Tax=Marinomonas ostreistagni TaxID=359209 RepID=A0ABS0ZCV2_9GAMM|nr:calcium-binding protein [Marinomonas ostreistagni]MBJ7551505.1 hypothetical protein [Marinomonas ostreistagni]
MTQSDTHLFKLTTLLFNAALGETYYRQSSQALANSDIATLAASWGQSDLASTYLGNTNEEQARNLTLNLGLNPDSDDTDSADSIAYQYFLSHLEDGMEVGTLALTAIEYLEQDDILDAFQSTRSYLANRAEAAYQYSTQLGLGNTDISTLQSVLEGVDADEGSISEALAQASQATLTDIESTTTPLTDTSASESITGSDDSSNIIEAGLGDDTIIGGSQSDILSGGLGADKIYGGKGQDSINGGGGSDYLEAGFYLEQDDAGNTSVDAFYEILNGGNGNDTVYGGLGSDSISGGDGMDYLYGEEYELTSSQREGIDADVYNLIMNDTIDGGAGSDFIQAGEGNDLIYGGTGSDTINASTGNDVAYGGAGHDVMLLGTGDDYAEGGDGNDVITLYTGNDTAFGGAGDDTISGTSNDSIDAGDDNDTISINRSENSADSATIVAGEGKDNLFVYSAILEADNSSLTIDLSETRAAQDTVTMYLMGDISSAITIDGFDLAIDQLDLNEYLKLYGDNSFQLNQGMKIYSDLGEILEDRVQIVTDIQTDWQSVSTAPSDVDEYGKSYFVIQGATAASDSVDDVAALLDDYGNNATYTYTDNLVFLVNVNETDMGVYLFNNSEDSDSTISADELTPVAILTGLSTELITQSNADFIIG